MSARETPPPLEYPTPPCSLCGADTTYEEREFHCYDCGLSWNAKTGHLDNGTWNSPDAPQCVSTFRPYVGVTHENLAALLFRCMLHVGHGSTGHRHPEYEWNDGQKGVGTFAPAELIAGAS